jgi:hypothetical protein
MTFWDWSDKHWVITGFTAIIGVITASEAVTWIGRCFHELCKRRSAKR